MPLEDLERFGYDEQEREGVVDERFVELMRFEIGARRLYALADDGMDYIPRGRRFPVVVARASSTRVSWTASRRRATTSSRAETSRPGKLWVARCAAGTREILLGGRLGRRASIALAPRS